MGDSYAGRQLQALLVEENPELSRGDAHDLAWEWVARADDAEH